MTQVDTFGAYVRARLEHWGREFALHRDCEYLGHRSKDTLQILIEHRGEMPPRATGYKPLEVDNEALQIERIVTELALCGGVVEACVLRGYFCGRGRVKTERFETANQLLSASGNSPLTVRGYINACNSGVSAVRGALLGLSMAA